MVSGFVPVFVEYLQPCRDERQRTKAGRDEVVTRLAHLAHPAAGDVTGSMQQVTTEDGCRVAAPCVPDVAGASSLDVPPEGRPGDTQLRVRSPRLGELPQVRLLGCHRGVSQPRQPHVSR